MRNFTSVADETGFYLLALCGALAPIPFGSNSPAVAGLIGAMLAAALLLSVFATEPSERTQRLIGASIALSVLLLIWTLIQALPPSSFDFFGSAPPPANGIAASAHTSLRLQPFHSVGYLLLPFAAFISALVFVRDDARYLTFLQILLGAAFVVTAFCVAEYALSPDTLLLQPKIHYLGSFTGTFVNPNTAASYFGVMLLASLSLCFYQYGSLRRQRHMLRASVSDPRLRNFLIYCIWTAVFAVALLLTRSRAGILSSCLAVVGYTWVHAFTTLRRRGMAGMSIAVSTVAAVGVVLIFILLAERVMFRVETEGLEDMRRLCTYQSTWRAIQDHFWLGTGLGSFQDVFPAYRSPACGLIGYWEMAHSVYLEAWLSLGLMFPLVLAIIYYWLIKTFAYGYRHRKRFRFVPLTSLAILFLLSLHSLVDFSLQIPGMSVIAALLLGAGAAVSLAPRSQNEIPADALPAT